MQKLHIRTYISKQVNRCKLKSAQVIIYHICIHVLKIPVMQARNLNK